MPVPDQDHRSDQAAPDQPVLAGPEASGPTASPARPRSGLGLRLFGLILLALVVMFYALVSTRNVAVPAFVVAEFETRANRGLQSVFPGMALSVESLEFGLEGGHSPVLLAGGLGLISQDGVTLLNLPEVSVQLDGSALLTGALSVTEARIAGAHLTLRRLQDGSFNLLSLRPSSAATPAEPGLPAEDMGRFFDLLDRSLGAEGDADGAAQGLPQKFLIQAASADFRDDISGQSLSLGDGQFSLVRQDKGFALSVQASVRSDLQPGLAQLTLTGHHDRAGRSIELSGQVAGLQAATLAANVPAVGWLQSVQGDMVLDYRLVLDDRGPSQATAELAISKGQIQPRPEATPVGFDSALMLLDYDRGQGRILIPIFSVDSQRLSLLGQGQILMVDAAGAVLKDPFDALPAAFLAQVSLDQVQIAADAIWDKPLVLQSALIEARLRTDPLTLDIGQVRLVRGNSSLIGTGQIGAGSEGWTAALDLALDQMSADELITLWPLNFLPLTRAWLVKNLHQGQFSNLNFALRLAQGSPGRGALTLDFADLDMSYLAGMPKIMGARGHATLDGPGLTFIATEGRIQPPMGGAIGIAGSSFSILDLAAFPAPAELRLKTNSDLTGILSLLDQKPFGFVTKAKLPVDLGRGSATIEARIGFPLKEKVLMPDLSLAVKGLITAFQSDALIKGRSLAFPALSLAVDNQGLTLSGQGDLDGVALTTEFTQGFASADKGKAVAKGKVTLDAAALDRFNLGLPKGMVSGQGQADYRIALQPDGPATLDLTASLQGIGLSLPELAWSKDRDAKGNLTLQASLGPVPQIDKISLTAPGLTAEGKISLKAQAEGGGLKSARFDRVTVGDWLNAAVEMTGRGKGQAPDIRIVEGRIDLRRLGDRSGFRPSSGKGGKLSLELDELVVADGIALTGFRGEFKTSGGLSGDFQAAVNGQAQVEGSVLSQRRGLAVRLVSRNAGALLAATGVIKTAVGGALTLTLTPLDKPGHYQGRAEASDFRLRHSSGLSELLNALSIVGLLESLNGSGILFTHAEADFVLLPKAIDLQAGSAIGGSMGLSMSGLYQSTTGRLDMQGTLSPFYSLNGIGAALTRKGEGLFGFNYRLSGSVKSPKVDVNPLSILTPGAFRELFRQPPPPVPDGN